VILEGGGQRLTNVPHRIECRRETMRVLIVDDEPLARAALASALAERTDVGGVDSANDGEEAMGKLQKQPYDIVLLDIRMPELCGIELLDQMGREKLPAVVFVTPHHEHAVKAFEKHAADYVLKPFSNDRIHAALDVAIHKTIAERLAKLTEVLPRLKSLNKKPERIAVKSKGRIFFVDPSEVSTVESEGNYVLLRQATGTFLLRGSISALADKLAPYGFVRIHRSVLVNAAWVEEIHPWATGEYVLQVKAGKEYTVSRKYKENLKGLAGMWIGAEAFSAAG
jgi:two-component system, LytTR family, response regulator